MKKLRAMHNLRIRKGYTIVSLAKKIGLSPQYLAEIERGEKELSYKQAFIISYYLDTTPDNLFYDNLKNKETSSD